MPLAFLGSTGNCTARRNDHQSRVFTLAVAPAGFLRDRCNYNREIARQGLPAATAVAYSE